MRVTTEDIGNHYDELDYVYRRIWGEHVHHGIFESRGESKELAVVNLIKLVAEKAKLKPGMRLCDVGCGYGGASRYFATHNGASVTGITISEQQLAYAREKYGDNENPKLRICDWLKNDFTDSQFDVVVSIESSEHMIDKELFFREAYRVLKPEGRLVVCAWIANNNPSCWEMRHLLEPICREGRLPSMGSELDYNKFISDGGLKLESALDITDKVKRTWTLCLEGIAKLALKQPLLFAKLFREAKNNREFLLTLPRIRLAYELKAMRYIVFTATK